MDDIVRLTARKQTKGYWRSMPDLPSAVDDAPRGHGSAGLRSGFMDEGFGHGV